MMIVNMQVNHLDSPLGFDLTAPTLSWNVDGIGLQKKTTRVVVASDAGFQNVLLDSGEDSAIDGIGYPLQLALQPRTRYFAKVSVTATSGEEACGETSFETGKMDEAWVGEWIRPSFHFPPYITKTFDAQEVSCARLYTIGRGLYEVYCNGQRVGEEYLAPGFSSYDLWEQVHTYDLTAYLKPGANTVGYMMGDGWYRGRLGWDGHYVNNYGTELMVRGELHLDQQVIGTDESWLCKKSPIISTSIYDGEIYDASMADPLWCMPEGDKSQWLPAVLGAAGDIPYQDRLRVPVRKHESFQPKLIITPKNEYVLDFGQNLAGWVEGDITLPAGGCLTLNYFEILQDDCYYHDNLRSAKTEYRYYSNGETAHFRPQFTFYGFRYVMVTGCTDEKTLLSFTAHALYSTMARTGYVETGHDLLNQFLSNVLWGQKGNFLDVPTDCPQRDERMGWTGDTQIFATTASYNMDTCAFYTKHMKDVMLEQELFDGGIPFIVPFLKKSRTISILQKSSSCAWGDIATVLPWTVYQHYGNKALLESQYPAMTGWVDFIHTTATNAGNPYLWLTGFHFADWLALDNYDDPSSSFGGTDEYYVASIWYAYSALLTAKAAKVLGKDEDGNKYMDLYEQVRSAILERYFTADGHCKIQTQTAQVLALSLGICRGEQCKLVGDDLHRLLVENDMKLTTGFCGTPFLCNALSGAGYSDDAYALLLREEIPGWLYEVTMGATTVWERWDSLLPDYTMNPQQMNSLNHYAYGAVKEWVYHDVCGIRLREDSPGFASVDIVPTPDSRLGYANCTYQSAGGTYESNWRVENGEITYTITVPFDRVAYVTLPGMAEKTLTSGTYTFTDTF